MLRYMAKRVALPFIFFTCVLAIMSAQNVATVKNKIKTGLEEAKLKGQVRCVIDTEYSFKNNPYTYTDSIYLGKAETWWYDKNGLLCGHIIWGVYTDMRYTFYRNGHKIKECRGNTENGDTSMADKLNETYDKYGNLILSWINGDSMDSIQVDSFTYDKRGNLLETGQRSKSLEIRNAPLRDYIPAIKYAYNDYDQLLWKHELQPGLVTIYKYDNDGNMIEESYLFTYAFMKYIGRVAYRYNNKGLKTDKLYIYADIDTLWHFTYDSLGNMLEEHNHMFIKPYTLTTMHHYQYDAYGNWVSDSVIRKPDGLIAVHQRRVEYY